MANTITAGNASNNGLAVSSDSSGTLNILTGPGAGTTAISIDASQNVAITGALTIGGVPAGGNYVVNSYVSPTTWDATTKKAAGLKAVKVTIIGGGGNGGVCTATPTPGASTYAAAGGGGGGGTTIYYAPASAIPAPVAVTAGASTNSFGAYCSATGGANGSNATNNAAAGGAAGTGSGGFLNGVGNAGLTGTAGAPATASGVGGSAAILMGGTGGAVATVGVPGTPTAAGQNATNYGGGGSGSIKFATQIASPVPGLGFPGIVIVEEFY